MRKLAWLGGVVLFAGLTAPASAQKASLFHGSFNPQMAEMQNVPINTKNTVAPVTNQQQPGFFSRLANLFHPSPAATNRNGMTYSQPSPSLFQPQVPFKQK